MIKSKFIQQWPMFLVGCGHGATHWVAAVFYILLPYLIKDLGIAYSEAGVFVALFHVSSFLTNFASGAVVDMSGRRIRYQTLALLIGAVALFAFGLSQWYLFLCAMVVVIGASNNLWHPAAISYLSNHYPQQRGYALSIHALGASLGDAVAPLAAGVLLVSFTWQGTAMLSSIPVFLLTAVFFLLFLPKEVAATSKVTSGISFSQYCQGMLQLLKRKSVLGLCLMSSLRSGAQQGLLVFLPLYLVDVLQVSPVVMGVSIMMMHVAGLIASPIAGIWSDRNGRRPVVMAGLSVTTVMIVALTLVNNNIVFVVAISVLGFALYAIRPVVHSWLMDLTPRELGGSAASALFGGQSIFNGLVPLAGGFIADSFGLLAVFYLIAAVMLAANIIVLLLANAELERGSSH